MLDRISEHAVTICMLGSYRWSYNASKSCSHTHTLVHTDQGNLWLGQPIQTPDKTNFRPPLRYVRKQIFAHPSRVVREETFAPLPSKQPLRGGVTPHQHLFGPRYENFFCPRSVVERIKCAVVRRGEVRRRSVKIMWPVMKIHIYGKRQELRSLTQLSFIPQRVRP